MLINVSHTSQSSFTDEKLATLSKYSHLLRHCAIFLRYVDRFPGVISDAVAMELWSRRRRRAENSKAKKKSWLKKVLTIMKIC